MMINKSVYRSICVIHS